MIVPDPASAPHNIPPFNLRDTLCGLDEAGRGALAGPLVAAAVILPPGFDAAQALPGVALRDSKQMTALQRERACAAIQRAALLIQISIIEAEAINARGIGWANRAIFEGLIASVEATYYIVDGNLKLDLPVTRWGRVESRVRADTSVTAVSAASIVAKVTRDRLMTERHVRYPVYRWDHNKGYGTPAHIQALRGAGLCPEHRTQFCQTALTKHASGPDGSE